MNLDRLFALVDVLDLGVAELRISSGRGTCDTAGHRWRVELRTGQDGKSLVEYANDENVAIEFIERDLSEKALAEVESHEGELKRLREALRATVQASNGPSSKDEP